MEVLRIRGGTPLYGTLEIGGAKNAALPILAATVVHGGKYVLHNCPEISDVAVAGEILTYLGGSVTRLGKTVTVDTRNLNRWTIPASMMEKMRASILFLGALLARFGRAAVTMPGGCHLGRRPIDLHLNSLAQMGAAVTLQEAQLRCEAASLHGCTIDLPLPSVGATENILLAATACTGTVILRNCAEEPEVRDLIRFLRSMGADIRRKGNGTLLISGGLPLQDTDHAILPDRIETATYLCAAAGCGGEITLSGTDGNLLLPVLAVLERTGCRISSRQNVLQLASDGFPVAAGEVETAPYPGFPTDAQALVMASVLRAEGLTGFTERMFENRFGHVPQLRRFGAQIDVHGASALVRGVGRLKPSDAAGCDLRASAALVVAALQIPGESRVSGLKHLDRGYDNLEGKLRSLGADLVRIQ